MFVMFRLSITLYSFFLFNDTATTEIYTLSLHDALPIYLFRHPEFVWKALSARPIWEGVASTFLQKLLVIGQAMSPKHMFAGDPFQIFSILAWIVLISAVLTIFGFVNLVRAKAVA